MILAFIPGREAIETEGIGEGIGTDRNLFCDIPKQYGVSALCYRNGQNALWMRPDVGDKCRMRDSNPRPTACKAAALPLS